MVKLCLLSLHSSLLFHHIRTTIVQISRMSYFAQWVLWEEYSALFISRMNQEHLISIWKISYMKWNKDVFYEFGPWNFKFIYFKSKFKLQSKLIRSTYSFTADILWVLTMIIFKWLHTDWNFIARYYKALQELQENQGIQIPRVWGKWQIEEW